MEQNELADELRSIADELETGEDEGEGNDLPRIGPYQMTEQYDGGELGTVYRDEYNDVWLESDLIVDSNENAICLTGYSAAIKAINKADKDDKLN